MRDEMQGLNDGQLDYIVFIYRHAKSIFFYLVRVKVLY